MERYWLAVLVVAFLTLSSANGAAFIGPGEEQQCMLDALYMYLYVPISLLMFVRSLIRILLSFPPGTRPRSDPHPAGTRDRTDLLCAVCISEIIFHTFLSMTVMI